MKKITITITEQEGILKYKIANKGQFNNHELLGMLSELKIRICNSINATTQIEKTWKKQ